MSLKWEDLWNYRELLYFLVWRDVKVRYKQTAIGVLWVLFQPLATTLVFTIVFHRLARIPSGDVPYEVFVIPGVLLWGYFSGSLSRCSVSLIGNANLITKVYFPRLVVPLAAVLTGWTDFAVGFLVVLGMTFLYGVPLGVSLFLSPLFLLLATLAALGTGLWLCALNVKYRDVGHLIPFLIQLWMFLTPVFYPSDFVPGPWRWAFGLNPMVGAIEGLRWSVLGSSFPCAPVLMSTVVAFFLCGSGLWFFQRMERSFADVI